MRFQRDASKFARKKVPEAPAAPPRDENDPPHVAREAKTRSRTALTVIGILAVFFAAVIGGSIYAVGRFTREMHAQEAQLKLLLIGFAARESYERDHALCASASAPVPAAMALLHGGDHESTSSDWSEDRAQNKGFACMNFSINGRQHYQYDYFATAKEFTATARSGRDPLEKYSLSGRVDGNHVVLGDVLDAKNRVVRAQPPR